MLFLTGTANGSAPSGGSLLRTFIPLIAMVLIFYFLIMRPQKKQEKQTAEMRNSIAVGDEIVTIGGIIGSVLIIKDDKLMIETGNDRTKLTILRSAVREVMKAEEEEGKS